MVEFYTVLRRKSVLHTKANLSKMGVPVSPQNQRVSEGLKAQMKAVFYVSNMGRYLVKIRCCAKPGNRENGKEEKVV